MEIEKILLNLLRKFHVEVVEDTGMSPLQATIGEINKIYEPEEPLEEKESSNLKDIKIKKLEGEVERLMNFTKFVGRITGTQFNFEGIGENGEKNYITTKIYTKEKTLWVYVREEEYFHHK